ncbi:MAG: hypothetical protein ACLPKE_36380 [Streptosporangiaceae bacterium]
MIAQHNVHHREQDQQQREERREGIVGHQGGEVTGLVVVELLPHRDGEGQPRVPLLVTIDDLDRLFR